MYWPGSHLVRRGVQYVCLVAFAKPYVTFVRTVNTNTKKEYKTITQKEYKTITQNDNTKKNTKRNTKETSDGRLWSTIGDVHPKQEDSPVVLPNVAIGHATHIVAPVVLVE